MDRLTERVPEGIWVKEDHGEKVPKTLYCCYGGEPLQHYSNCSEGYCGMERLADYEDSGLCPEAINTMKADVEYWKNEARQKCAAAGELRIEIGQKTDELSREILRAEGIRNSIMTETDLAYVDGRIREMQEFWMWLKSLEGGRNGTGEA